MSLLLQDLSHPTGARRGAARRTLQAVLARHPAAVTAVTVTSETLQMDADDCGWLVRCRALPSWRAGVEQALARALRSALQQETATQPVRWYLAALHLYTLDSNGSR
jgi:hypothetical protein